MTGPSSKDKIREMLSASVVCVRADMTIAKYAKSVPEARRQLLRAADRIIVMLRRLETLKED